MINNGSAKAVELHIAEMALIDLICPYRLTESMSRQVTELAWTAIGTIAIEKLSAFDLP
jgi:hypothetical protein